MNPYHKDQIPPHLMEFFQPAEIGLESTPEEFVAALVEVFREVKRVLRPDGTLWVNLGDSYAGGANGAKPKDLIGIPWRVAFALQADGWYLRQDIVWCLSGGTWLYVRSQKGDMPMTVKDLARLDPSSVQLWNGEQWTQLLGMSKNARKGDEIELVLRSGERISCTPTHQFPTTLGLVAAAKLKVGDVLTSCKLPEPDAPRDCAIDEDAAWLAGLYLAEGSRSGNTIQIAGHIKETARWERVQQIVSKFGGSATMSVEGNNQAIRIYGKVLNAIIDELVSGRTAHDKAFAPVVWRYSDRFIAAMVGGYLSGDGHEDGPRWRLGFCRNYNLERDLRVACARLGYTLTLNLAHVEYEGKQVPTFRGELRKERIGHHNERDRNEIVKIGKARCRAVYDLGVADDPHLFALASGVLTHNSKPNPMPESVTDRFACTKSHEYVFLFAHPDSGGKYFYDAEAVREPVSPVSIERNKYGWNTRQRTRDPREKRGAHFAEAGNMFKGDTRNKRSVWGIPTAPYAGSHFATWPPELVRPMVRAGTSAHGCCSGCGAPWVGHTGKSCPACNATVPSRAMSCPTCGHVNDWKAGRLPPEDVASMAYGATDFSGSGKAVPRKASLAPNPSTVFQGWVPSCKCVGTSRIPATVLDPFSGSATTGMVALQEGQNYVGCDLNPDYLPLAMNRVQELSAPGPSSDKDDAEEGDAFDLFSDG